MATTTDLVPHRGQSRLPALRGASPEDRASRFARARRHSHLVRTLRWSLPAGAAGIVVLYVAVVLKTIGWVETLPEIAIPKIIPENLTMENPRYEGFNSDGGSYVVTAKTAVQDLADLSRVELNEITGDLTDANKAKTHLTAARGLYNSKTSELELYDGIDIKSETGLHAKLSRATVTTKDSLVVSREPVVVEMPAGTIRSKELTMRTKSREVTFLDAVEAHLKPEAPTAAPAPRAARPGPPRISPAGGPIHITANRLDIDDTDRIATFSGSVRAVQGDAALETAALAVSYEGAEAGTVPAASSGRVRRISSKSPVVLTRAPADRVTASTLDFDALREVAVLTGDVVMTSGPERTVSSLAAEIDQKADTVLLTGKVVAVQGRNRLSGERLLFERAAGRTHLSSPAAGGGKPGRIATRFYGGATASPRTWAPQQDKSGAAAGVFKTDPNAPIDVEADRLNVDDRAKTAVFRGDVRARQGDFVVRTSELTARYKGQAGLAETADAAGRSEPAALQRIEARGKVIVTSKDDQSATGDWADFDVATNKVTLGGDVVLTQGRNVVRGTRLIIDMVSGQSLIHNEPAAAWSATAPSEGNGFVRPGPTSGNRPSAVFYPRAAEEQAKKKEAPRPASQSPQQPDTGTSWEPAAP